VFIAGADMLNGTPILDIKPYIADYDSPNDALNEATIDADRFESIVKGSNEGRSSSIRPDWIGRHGVEDQTSESSATDQILFTERSLQQLQQFHSCDSEQNHVAEQLVSGRRVRNTYLTHKLSKVGSAEEHPAPISTDQSDLGAQKMKCLYCLAFLDDWKQVGRAIVAILSEDPRSAYRRKKGADKLYYFTVDTLHVTCWFDPDERSVEVLKVRPNYAFVTDD
jgi:hypothetical protein